MGSMGSKQNAQQMAMQYGMQQMGLNPMEQMGTMMAMVKYKFNFHSYSTHKHNLYFY